MPSDPNLQRFRNEDLVLRVSPAVDRTRWDESRYEEFLDELCGNREYQKEAIRTAIRFLLGGEYNSLSDLARQNFQQNPLLAVRHGSWAHFERSLQFPDQLAASLQLPPAEFVHAHPASAAGPGVSRIMRALPSVAVWLSPTTTSFPMPSTRRA